MVWTNDEFEAAISYIKHGLSYSEIAKVLNRSRESVKFKLHRGGFFYTDVNSKSSKCCIECGDEIIGHGKKFCGHSCSASYNNLRRVRNNYTYKGHVIILSDRICLYCNTKISGAGKKYCNIKCQVAYHKQLTYSKIESGDATISSSHCKKYLIDKYGNKCMQCGWGEVNRYSKSIPIELEHIDGDSRNNDIQNLKLLCPNCHSLTPTYKSLNVGNGRHIRRDRYRAGKSY